MGRGCDKERHLRAVEDDIRFGECLVGRMAALAAVSSAKGKAERARDVHRLLKAAEEALVPLYAMRGRLRQELRMPGKAGTFPGMLVAGP